MNPAAEMMNEILDCLNENDVRARPAFSGTGTRDLASPLVTVSVAGISKLSGCLGDYIGFTDVGGETVEVYAERARTEFYIDIFAPDRNGSGPALCMEAFFKVDAALQAAFSGIEISVLSVSEAGPDAKTGLVTARAKLAILKWVYASEDGVPIEIDLRGVINIGNLNA